MSESLDLPPRLPTWHYLAALNAVTGDVMNVSRSLRVIGHDSPGAVLAEGQVSFTLSAEQYKTVLSGPHRVIAGVLEAYVQPVDIEKIRADALTKVDAAAEWARLKFITSGSGQALEYQATQIEALKVVALGVEPLAIDVPWLVAERDAMAVVNVEITLMGVAQMIVGLMTAWTQAGAEIKYLRRTAKLLIKAAATVEEITLAGKIVWPIPT